MTTDTSSSYFPSLPSTFGWRRVVDLADEFKVSPADMVAISNRLGLIVADASEWLDEDSVDLIRSTIASRSAKGVLSGTDADAKTRKAPKPVKVRGTKLVPIVVGLALLAGATGVVLDRWIDQVTNTDAPATVVTTDGK